MILNVLQGSVIWRAFRQLADFVFSGLHWPTSKHQPIANLSRPPDCRSDTSPR